MLLGMWCEFVSSILAFSPSPTILFLLALHFYSQKHQISHLLLLAHSMPALPLDLRAALQPLLCSENLLYPPVCLGAESCLALRCLLVGAVQLCSLWFGCWQTLSSRFFVQLWFQEIQ